MSVQEVQEVLAGLTKTEQLEIAYWLFGVALSERGTVQLSEARASYRVAEISSDSLSDVNQQDGSADREREILSQELVAFESSHSRLFSQIPGQYAAIYQGQLVDHDEDQFTLYMRLQKKYGDEPVLIKQVNATPLQDIVVRSPRFDHG